MEKVIFEINPFYCVGCAKKIEDCFHQQPGIVGVNIYGQLGRILVRYDESETNADQFEKILLELDYVIKAKTTA